MNKTTFTIDGDEYTKDEQSLPTGVIKVKHPQTLQKWIKSGKYMTLIKLGYIYAIGCGRFRDHKCTCYICRTQERLIHIQVLRDNKLLHTTNHPTQGYRDEADTEALL